MKSKNWLLLLLYLLSTVYCFFIGLYETLYGLGIYLLITIQAVGLVIFLIHLMVTRFFFSRRAKSQKSLTVGIIAVVFLQLFWIVNHTIENHEPTYTISIPEDYKGRVYLFTTIENKKDTDVDSLGFGYLGNEGKGQYEVVREGLDISDALHTSQFNEIAIYSEDSTKMAVYQIACFELNDSNIYTARAYDESFSCMEASEFLQLIEEKYIDESKLRKSSWKRDDTTTEEWMSDYENTRWK